MTYTGLILKAAVQTFFIFLCGIFAIVLGPRKYVPAVEKPTVVIKPSVVSKPVQEREPAKEPIPWTAAPSILHNVRMRTYDGFTPIVYESQRPRTLRIDSSSSNGIASHNKRLVFPGDTERLFQRYSGTVSKVNHQKKKRIRQILERIAQTLQPASAMVQNPETKGPIRKAEQPRKITTFEPPSKPVNFSTQLEKIHLQKEISTDVLNSSKDRRPPKGADARSASATILHNVRMVTHTGFTRIVFDSEGARPLSIGPVSSEGIAVRYDRLDFLYDPRHFSHRYRVGAVAKVSHQKEAQAQKILIAFRQPDTRVKSSFLAADPP
jgi:hypothetical protein